MNLNILAAATLTPASPIAAASAQCVDCDMYPDRDRRSGGALTPADKMRLVRAYGGAPVSSGPAETLAGARDQVMQESNATLTSLKRHASRRNNSAH